MHKVITICCLVILIISLSLTGMAEDTGISGIGIQLGANGIFTNDEPGEFSCGTVVTPEQIAYEKHLMEQGGFEPPPKADGDYYVPVSFHIVRRSDGTGGYAPERLHISMRDLNWQYEQVGIQFYRLRDEFGEYAIHYIDDDNYYYNTNNTTMYSSLRMIDPVPNTINVYFVPVFPYCGLSSFSTSSTQGIIMANSCSGATDNHSTLAHEIGHYFDLYHTHETAWGEECPDGSNCHTAGDLLCDTPADPQLSSYNVSSSCTYFGSETPPSGCSGTYAPQVDNLMSYSLKLCRDFFFPRTNH